MRAGESTPRRRGGTDRPATRRAVGAAILVTLAGCAATGVPPPPREPLPLDLAPRSGEPLASREEAGGGAVEPDAMLQWWARFDDPLLVRLVARAWQANTTIEGAEASVRQARAARDLAAAALAPTLDASASATRSARDREASNTLQAGLSAAWAPDVFGGRRQAVAASLASEQASVASLGDARVQVAAEVGLAYLALRATQQRQVLARESLARQEETLQIARWRRQAGLVSALDEAQASAAAEQARATLPALQAAIDQSRHALAVLAGRGPDDAASLGLVPAAPLPRVADDPAAQIPAETLRQRADVRAAERQVAAARARVAQAEAARWPGFSIGGSFSTSAASWGALGSGPSLLRTLVAGVTWPLLDGGAARAQVRAQEAALDAARSGYRATALAALQQVADGLVALDGDRERRSSLRLAARAAEEAATLARRQYESGLVDFTTVLSTERTRISAQDAEAQADADVGADQVRLFTALGGGWRDAGGAATSRAASGSSLRTARP